ncbi:hypothetical protein [Jiangella muralis]|uniref:hypothetical protein n=1 Tax=Jiangella muralis TaxID=702383 RepID=UPI00069DDB02|nr:hypothetical protein [Jiangella muralis]
MTAALRKIRKALGALLGGATGAAVVQVAAAFEVDVDPTLAGAIAIILAAAGAYLAPANDSGVPALDLAQTVLRRLGHDPNDVARMSVTPSGVVVERYQRDEFGMPVKVDHGDGDSHPQMVLDQHPHQGRGWRAA